MSAPDLHPEELIDRARRGAASDAELASIAEHLASCPTCRLEKALATDAAHDALARASDELVIARLRRSTARALLARGARPFRARRARGLLLAAAALLVGSASLAGVLGYRALSNATPAPSAAVASTVAAQRAPVPPIRDALPPPLPPAPPQPLVETQPEPARSAAPQPKHSASDLFADANRARRSGDVAQAARGYRELIQRYPNSAEAQVARVSFGRLLLDRLGNARGALHEFDGYLNGSSNRALREEALIGRAVALGRLGRAAEERSAWHTLLRAYPNSMYASRARTRLAELGSPTPAP
ncbi:MAG: tetratricopeptide repeat protein [Myxococcota bacterium]